MPVASERRHLGWLAADTELPRAISAQPPSKECVWKPPKDGWMFRDSLRTCWILTLIPEGDFDAVICIDNALPHLDGLDQVAQATTQIRTKLRPGGLFVAGIRDYDALVREKPVVQGPAFYTDDGRRRIVHQVWDWFDDRRYTFHLYITRETSDGWESQHYVSTYCALLRAEMTSVLEQAGFIGARWFFPAESGFYQPIVLAKTPVGVP